MTNSEGEKKTFKVVDRRRFDEEGGERSGPDVVKEDAKKPVAPAAAVSKAEQPKAEAPRPTEKGVDKGPADKRAADKPGPDRAGPDRAGPDRAGPEKGAKKEEVTASGLTFSIFVQSLAQQALMQLGLIPWPHGQRELHVEQARDTIEIIGLLKAKTKGNLTKEEEQLLDTVVYELKMSFVEVQQAIARSRGASPLPKPPGR